MGKKRPEERLKPRMTAKKKAFVYHYVQTMNATEAARRAGYQAKNDAVLGQIGYENLRLPEIRGAIDEMLKEHAMSAAEVLTRLTNIARGDIGDLLTHGVMDWGKAKDRTYLIKEVKETTVVSEQAETHVYELKLHDPLTALRMLAQYHNLLASRVVHAGDNQNPVQIVIEWDDGDDNSGHGND